MTKEEFMHDRKIDRENFWLGLIACVLFVISVAGMVALGGSGFIRFLAELV